MNHSLRFVFETNNAGVSALQRGDASTAMGLFRNGLCQAQAAMDGVLAVAIDPSSVLPNESQAFKSVALETVPVLDDPEVLERESGFESVFARAFVMSGVAPDEDSGNFSVGAAILLYNAGLCHHFLALNKRSQLNRALKLYEMSLSILNSELHLYEEAQSDELALLLMALLNNVMTLHAQSFRCDDMKQCRDQLRGLIEKTQPRESIDAADFDFFFLTLLLSSGDYTYAATPAA